MSISSSWVRPGGVDEARLRAACAQLAEALSALHAAGKVHRDIKPSNVLVDGDGHVWLLDFGLVADRRQPANVEGDGDVEGVVGTAQYMAPEQAAAHAPVGPAADWYSVGVVLYESLTGQVPYAGTSRRVLADKRRGLPPDLAALEAAPPELAQLCRELLQHDPTARPDGAAVLARLSSRARLPDGPATLDGRIRPSSVAPRSSRRSSAPLAGPWPARRPSPTSAASRASARRGWCATSSSGSPRRRDPRY